MQDYKCIGGHKVDGKIPTVEDIHLIGKACDCKKFVVNIGGCGCNGAAKKIVLKPNIK